MTDFLSRIRAGEALVSDGGLGSLLMERGLPPGASPESLNLTRPEIVEEVAGEYAQAGADLITTNTFGGSPLKLAAHGLADRMEEINRAGVAVAQRAVAALSAVKVAKRAVVAQRAGGAERRAGARAP